MSPHEERRSCWPRAKYGSGFGRAIWAARRRRHPESLNNRTAPQQRSWQECASEAEVRCWMNQSAFSAESGLSEVQQPNSLQATLPPIIQPPRCGYGRLHADIPPKLA